MSVQAKNKENMRIWQIIITAVIAISLTMLPTGILADKQYESPEASEPRVSLAAGFAHSAMIDYDGSLYLWGDNTYGQVAGGNESYIDQPQLIELDDEAIQVSLGAWHTLVLTDNGDVYSSGRNTFGQLGNGTWENSSGLEKIADLSNISAIAAGSYHSMALGEDGSLWVWGNNTNDQLAHANSEELKDNEQIVARRTSQPEKIVDSGIIQIAAGGHFSLYLDESGLVYAFGDNSKGQLGDGTTEDKDIPVKVTDIEEITYIAAGYEFALAISEADTYPRVFTWGDNSLGQLGIGQPGGFGALRSRPAEIELFTNLANYDLNLLEISDVAVGYAHVFMTLPEQIRVVDDPDSNITTNELSGYHKLLSWGNNAFGQLGSEGAEQIYTQPTILAMPNQAESARSFVPFDAIAAGGSHSLIMSSLGQLAAAGRGNQGQLGTVSIIDRNKFTAIETTDHILPAWSDTQAIMAEFDNDNNLQVRWSAAQNNRSNTMYRLEIRTKEGQLQMLEAGESISREVKNLDPEQPLAFRVLAYDTASENFENDRLSYLYGAYFPEEYDISQWDSDFDQPFAGAVQKTATNQSWMPDPAGRLPYPAVPWEQPAEYDTRPRIEIVEKQLPIINIILMVLSSIIIIGIALWLAINFHKERFLLYPLRLPTQVKRVLSKLKAAFSRITGSIKKFTDAIARKLPYQKIKSAARRFAAVMHLFAGKIRILASKIRILTSKVRILANKILTRNRKD